MTSLSTISNELKLLIIEQLAILEPKPSPSNEGWGTEQQVTPSANEALINLSTVNRNFRVLVAPLAFRTLILRNTARSGTAINFVAQSKLAHLVKKVEYVAFTGCDDDGEGLDYPPRPDDFPLAVEEVLENLGRFPSLEGVGMQLAFRGEEYDEGFYYFEDPEVAEDVEKKDLAHGWRALITASYAALARNPPGTIKALQLRDLVPVESSCWHTDAWRVLLGGLRSLEISLAGGENGALTSMGTQFGFQSFVSGLRDSFFVHLASATHVGFAASDCGAVGIDIGYHSVPLPLNNTVTVPHLQSFSLHSCFISVELAMFLARHAATLRSVRFTNCLAYDDPPHFRVLWANFFNVLLAADPQFVVLREFHVLYETPGEQVDSDLDARLLYGYVDDKYGFVSLTKWDDFDFDEWMTEDGPPNPREREKRDEKAYEAFLAVVNTAR